MNDCRFDCTNIVFATHGELAIELAVDLAFDFAVDLAFDFAVDLALDLPPHSPADTQRCRVETAALPV